MSLGSFDLTSGDTLTIECREAPLRPQDVTAFSGLVNSHLEEPFLTRALAGRWREDATFVAFMGRCGGDLVATAWVAWARELPAVGVVAGVATVPAMRRLGIATRMGRAACEHFDRQGGELLYLAAATPEAQQMYDGLGFESVAGKAMCRVASGHDPFEGFAPSAAVRARPAYWGDMARIVPLYYFPQECLALDTVTGFASSRVQPPLRCVGIFWNTWRTSVADGGIWHVLENQNGWVVGSAVARLQPDAVAVDYAWHPAYEEEGRAFLTGFLSAVAERTSRPCRLLACEGDAWKLRHAAALGFSQPQETKREVNVAGRGRRVLALSSQSCPK